MKRLALLTAITLFAVLLQGCRIEGDWIYGPDYYDYDEPSAPRGVYVINGDREVEIRWRFNWEDDISGYNVYVSDRYNGVYELIGSTSGNSFFDRGVRNGKTYYYAVAAYDFSGNESNLSKEQAYTTPRPEGYGRAIFDYLRYPNTSGYVFGADVVVAYDDKQTDFFFENENGAFWLNVYNDSDIQSMGQTGDLYDIPYAPSGGWATAKSVRAYVGHTYVIWTFDNHFAKIRITSITQDRVVFDWAYQTVQGVIDLKPAKQQRVLESAKLAQ